MAGPIALFAMPPLFPALTAFLGVSLSGIGFTAMTSFGIGISVMAIPFAILSPRLGWKTAGIACLGTISMAALITTVFPTFWGIFLGRFIAGLGFGMAFTWQVGALSVWFRKDEMGLATGIWATTLPVSGLLILVLAPVLITLYGWISVLWFSFLFAIASLALWADVIDGNALGIGRRLVAFQRRAIDVEQAEHQKAPQGPEFSGRIHVAAQSR